jgi:putative tryptophan/tyrosine transport system substrate-binding protein
MDDLFTVRISKYIKGAIWVCLILIVLSACKAKNESVTIGIVSSINYDKSPTWSGFTDGMTELGYYEGKNLKYILKNVPENDEQKIDTAVKELQDKRLSLLLTYGGDIVDMRIRKLSKRSNLPVLFNSGPKYVESGMVKSISYPEGNMTGVQGVDCIPKALELLKKLIPGPRKVFLPYNPDDSVSGIYLQEAIETASQIEVNLILLKVHSVEEVVEAIENLPVDVDAIFMIPSPTLNVRNQEMSRVAIKKRIPVGSGLQLDDDVLITFSNDFYEGGKKMAKMAQKIINGTQPANIPVETMDTKLIINLKTAEKIGINIPNYLLVQANVIIR